MDETTQNLKIRTIYFDYLRVFATFAVMILHISAQNWYSTDINGVQWQIFNFFESITRWGVPVFLMISGALFLNRDITIKKIYTKYILRMITSYFIWSAIYALFAVGSTQDKITEFWSGHYHMWFILMIIGTYMCIPCIKLIISNEHDLKYYLLLTFLFAFAIPEFITFSKDFGNELVIKTANIIKQYVNTMNLNIFLGYTSYFILGYYINKITLNKKQRLIIYILGGLGFISTIGLSSIITLKTQTPSKNYYGNFTVNMFLEAFAVFTWFKYKKYNNHKLNVFIQKLSKYSFGAYLIHALVIEQLDFCLGLNTLSFDPTFSVIFIGVLVFIIAFSISAILNQLPFINKYMV